MPGRLNFFQCKTGINVFFQLKVSPSDGSHPDPGLVAVLVALIADGQVKVPLDPREEEGEVRRPVDAPDVVLGAAGVKLEKVLESKR